jgi:uncharacterized lipoprotein YmbA
MKKTESTGLQSAHHQIAPFALLCGIVLLTGCASTQESKLYVLHSPAESEQAPLKASPSIFVAPVQIPGYLDQPAIITQATETELTFSDFHRWAEPVEGNLRQKIASDLSNQLNSKNIFSQANKQPKEADYRLEVQVIYLSGVLGDVAKLKARWRLHKNGNLTKTDIFTGELPLADASYNTYVLSQSSLLLRMSQGIADAIIENDTP